MEEQKKKQNGITLIALVISIIVMLILAGVSLNMTVGDNGIIKQAQNATYQTGMAALEEWLQQEYVKNFDDIEEYMSKPEMLASKISNLFLKDGNKNYVIYNGKMYYLINKSALPKEIQSGLVGGNSTNYSDYIRLIDVYGVTSELKVYYCLEGNENLLGTAEELEVDPNTKMVKINSNDSMKSAVIGALAQQGIIIDADGEIKYSDIASIKELTLDGSTYTANNLLGISELRNLRKLVLTNCKLSSLSGIESCIYLSYFYNRYSDIGDYTALSQCVDLNYLYMYRADNNNVKRMSEGLAESNLTKLTYLGIFGHENPINGYEGREHTSYSWGDRTDVTDISYLSKISEATRNAVQTLYIGNNKITDVKSLSYFPNLVFIEMFNNTNLTSLQGLENHNSLVTLRAEFCSFSDMSAVVSCPALTQIFVHGNPNLSKIYVGDATTHLYAKNCNIKDIDYLKGNADSEGNFLGKSSLTYLLLSGNTNLANVANIKYSTSINCLYLENNNSMIVNDVKQLETIIKKCGNNYSIPSKYLKYFTTTQLFDYGGYKLEDGSNLTDYTEEIAALKDATHVSSLSLRACSYLGSSRVVELLHNGTFSVSDIDKILANLTLTDSQKNYLQSLKSYSDTQFRAMNQSQMESMESTKNDISLRYILSTMTGLQVLSIWDVTNLTSIDFMNKLTKMKLLDLRGTNITNLSVLETMTVNNRLALSTIVLSNTGIELNTIQTVINKLDGGWGINGRMNLCPSTQCSTSGLVITNDTLTAKLSTCKNLTKLVINNPAYRGYANVDLSNSKLTTISSYGTSVTFKYPSTTYSVSRNWINNVFDDFTNCTHLNLIAYNDSALNTVEGWTNFCNSMATIKGSVTKINVQGAANLDFGIFANKFSPTSIAEIDINGTTKVTYTNLSSLSKYATKGLTTFYVNGGKIVDLSWTSGITSLVNLTVINNQVADINGVQNLTKLSNLNLNTNFVKDLSPLNNLSSLATLDVSNNLLENYYVYSKGSERIEIYNIDILYNMYNLNRKNGETTGPLRYLYMTNNPISDDSKIRSLNWSRYTDYAGVVVK